MKRGLSIACVILLGIAPLLAEGVKVKVKGNRVNLRAAANSNVEVVAQVNEGETLYAPDGVNATSEWIRVEPPSTADVYIYAELVRDGKVSATRVNVRSGAGIAYKVVGRVEKGDPVAVRGTNGDWLRIAPPPQCYLWIHRDYIEPVHPPKPKPTPPIEIVHVKPTPQPIPKPVPKPVPKPKPKPIPRPTPRPVETPRVLERQTTELPAAIANRKLVSAKKQGEDIHYVGTLRRAGWVWGRPSKFRLVVQDESGRPITLCYLLGSEKQLGVIEGHTLQVFGQEYWIQGVKSPVVVPDQIIRKD